jgi:ferredoxin-NADP reductase
LPLRSILRHRERTGSTAPVRLLYSSRTLDDVIYHAEFDQPASGVEIIHTLTRRQPPGWAGYPPERVKTERFGATGGP